MIACGTSHTCALTITGRVFCWGNGKHGRLGYGSIANVYLPVHAGYVPLGGKATQIVAGGMHTCARMEGGAMKCWGRGRRGQLGHGEK